ncbi:hypothetical protein LCGC14_2162140 [marine sediment metagenome]|uniref:Uncharacterized protein n=1 Tax=marine sediment metagenome TaxID=412755 RepID=A0A0F9DSC4_9ZZZZ
MPGRYETITVNEVIAGCKMQLRITDSSFDDFLALYVNEGIRNLNCLSLFVKMQCTLDIIDLKSLLPNGFQRLLGLRYSKTVTGETVYQNMLYIDKRYISTPSATVSNYEDTFQISKGYIHYNNDVNATEATLAYLGLNIDEFGNLVVYSDYERALRAYVCYNYALAFHEDFKESTTQRYENTWKAQKSYIKGEDVANDFKNRKYEMSKIFKAFLLSDFAVL